MVTEQLAHFGPSLCIAASWRVTLRNADAPLVRPVRFPVWNYMREMRGFRSLSSAKDCLPLIGYFLFTASA